MDYEKRGGKAKEDDKDQEMEGAWAAHFDEDQDHRWKQAKTWNNDGWGQEQYQKKDMNKPKSFSSGAVSSYARSSWE
jgi:hypothetical protein